MSTPISKYCDWHGQSDFITSVTNMCTLDMSGGFLGIIPPYFFFIVSSYKVFELVSYEISEFILAVNKSIVKRLSHPKSNLSFNLSMQEGEI